MGAKNILMQSAERKLWEYKEWGAKCGTQNIEAHNVRCKVLGCKVVLIYTGIRLAKNSRK